MKRRMFVKTGAAAAMSLSLNRTVSALSGDRKPALDSSIPAVGNDHPLYFDGMTFLADNPADAGKSGLSGLILDVSAVETVGTTFTRPFKACLKSITAARREMNKPESPYFLATRGSEIGGARPDGKIAVFFQFQSMEPMIESLDVLDTFYELGLRVCQFTHHATNPYGGGSLEKEWTGLTERGFQGLERMNALGIIPDLSHANEVLAGDVLSKSKKTVIASHTACRAIVNNARCLPDSVIKRIADSGGVVGIFSMSFWLTNDPVPTVDSYVRQLEHVIRVGGIDAVGISNDYSLDGVAMPPGQSPNSKETMKGYESFWEGKARMGVLGFDTPIPQHSVIPEMNDIRRFFTIQAALEKKGRKAAEIEKIMGGNWIRVLREGLI